MCLVAALGLSGTLSGNAWAASRGKPDVERLKRANSATTAYTGVLDDAVRIEHPRLSAQDRQRRRLLRDYAYAAFLLQTRRLDEAEKVLAQHKDRSVWPEPMHRLRARLLLMQGRTTQAREVCLERIEASRADVDLYLLLAQIEEADGRGDEVVAALERVRALAPRQVMVLEALSQKYGTQLRQAGTDADRRRLLDSLEGVYRSLTEARPGRPAARYYQILAFISQQKGDLAGAIELLRQAVAVRPEWVDAHVDLANALLVSGQRDEALAVLRRAVVRDPDDRNLILTIGGVFSRPAGASPDDVMIVPPPDPKASTPDGPGEVEFFRSIAEEYPGRDDIQVRYVRVLVAHSQMEEAARVLSATLKLHPHNQANWLFLARLHAAQNRKDEARQAIDRYLEQSPRNAAALLQTTEFLAAIGASDQARQCLERLRAVEPDHPALTEMSVRVDLTEHRFEQARKTLEAALAKDSSNARNYLLLADTLSLMGRTEEAVARLTEGLERVGESERDEVRRRLVGLYRQAGRLDDALALLIQMAKDRPSEPQWEIAVGETLVELNRAREAPPHFLSAIAKTPASERRPLRLRLVGVYQQGRQYDEALALMREIAKEDPEDREVQVMLGRLCAEAGQVEEADRLIAQLTAKYSDDPAVLYQIGLIHYELERYGQAEEVLRKTIALSPDSADAHNTLGYLFAERGERLDEALQLVRRALELKPDAGYIIDSLGWVYYQKGDYAQAVKALEEAADKEGDDPVVLEHLGQAYLKVGRHDEGLLRLKEARRQFENAGKGKEAAALDAQIRTLESQKE